MTLFKVPIISYIVLPILSIILVFGIKYHVENLSKSLHNIKVTINETKNSIEMLEAEWSYLTRPARLKILAEKYLTLEPILYSQVDINLDHEYSILASAD